MKRKQGLTGFNQKEKDDFINSIVLSLDNNYHYWHIHGNVPSSKNNKIAYKVGRFCSIRDSEKAKKYKDEKEKQYYEKGLEFRLKIQEKAKPLEVGFFFINNTNVRFDIINKMQVVQDMMVKHGWIDDDNVQELVPYFPKINGYHYAVNESYAGVIIMIRR